MTAIFDVEQDYGGTTGLHQAEGTRMSLPRVVGALGIAALLALAVFTSSKLVKMAKIRGWLPSVPPVMKTITDKAVLSTGHGESFWIAWDEADIKVPGRNRVNLDKEQWEALEPGDSLEVLYLPGAKWPYLRNGIFVSAGNFIFDIVLLAVWLAGIALIVRANRRGSGRKRFAD